MEELSKQELKLIKAEEETILRAELGLKKRAKLSPEQQATLEARFQAAIRREVKEALEAQKTISGHFQRGSLSKDQGPSLTPPSPETVNQRYAEVIKEAS